MNNLTQEYKKYKSQIRKRLNEFKNLHKGTNEDIFAELCFCILTPQSKAIYCDKAVKDLKISGLLFYGNNKSVRDKLKKVRFPNNKTKYLIEARDIFNNGFNNKLKNKNTLDTRNWLANNIKGLGLKEASHFLRNIGLGKDMAILDVHILRNLKKYGVIKKIPSNMNKKIYLNIENKMKKFSKKMNIPMEELDLLFWARETGYVFK